MSQTPQTPQTPQTSGQTAGGVVVLVGSGSIGQACVRRVAAGRHVVVADLHEDNAQRAADVLADAGFSCSTAQVDVADRASVEALAAEAQRHGPLVGLVHAAGVSPSQASPETILRVDLYGTALVLEVFGRIVAEGGSAVVIASQSGYRLPALTAQEDAALATTPVEELLDLPIAQGITDPLHAYQVSKRGNVKRVMAEAVRWGERGARVNCISPGIIMTPLARDELTGPRAAGYLAMLEKSPAHRAGTPDEVATVAELLMSPAGAFMSGSDILMDGGTTASWYYGPLRPGA